MEEVLRARPRPTGEVQNFVVVTGLDFKTPGSYTPEMYMELLKEKGPIWLVISDGVSSHAKLLIGISGDHSRDVATSIFIDPRSGTIVRQNFLDFILDYEHEAFFINEKRPDIPFRVQILYFS